MIKKFITISLFAMALMLVSQKSNAQSIYFCEGVSDDGYPIIKAQLSILVQAVVMFMYLSDFHMRLPATLLDLKLIKVVHTTIQCM